MRENLNEEWVWFQRVVIDSDTMLQREKEKFKNNLAASHQEFKVKILHVVEDFNRTGPSLTRVSQCIKSTERSTVFRCKTLFLRL